VSWLLPKLLDGIGNGADYAQKSKSKCYNYSFIYPESFVRMGEAFVS
jgi:hypothetical protein